jgi:tRNA dimethylallyltransferase
MDSMTLYRGMDIGTAKPSVGERTRIRHHLIDVLDPWESGNVAWWLREAERCCREIEGRGKQALFVGGTPFYLKALLQGIFDAPPADLKLRRDLEEEARAIGPAAFHARLAAIDPASAQRLHYNDTRRIVRALEVWKLTGKPLSELQQQGWWGPTAPGGDRNRVEEGFSRCIALDVPREELYSRINSRVESMMASGWVDEVRRLRQLPKPMSREASKALGYREIGLFLDGQGTLAQTVEAIQLRSRQFAKRQLTWFRNLEGCQLCEGKLTFSLWRRKMS